MSVCARVHVFEQVCTCVCALQMEKPIGTYPYIYVSPMCNWREFDSLILYLDIYDMAFCTVDDITHFVPLTYFFVFGSPREVRI